MLHRVAGAPLDFAALRRQLGVPGDFVSEVTDEARRSAAEVELPAEDATDIPLVTIDPRGSRDLDQAVHIARAGTGYFVSYAIADVAAFVAPGGAIDAEAHRRGETLYFPDVRVPLHPPLLSEGAASLLPNEVRPAVLWRIDLAEDASVRTVDVRRARVRSTAQLDYVGVQHALDSGALPDPIAALPDVGRGRQALARQRHAIDLDLPEQEVERRAGQYVLTLRATLPVEQYNAEISLLTGMCAAQLMLDGRFGILRTVPPPDDGAVNALRHAARALGISWPHGAQPGDVLAAADRKDPKHFAFVEHAASLLRGAAYTSFDGTPPAQPPHSGIGAPYAHVTAPLRRLVDRYASEICLALHAGTAVPDWVRAALPMLPDEMQKADKLAHEVDRAAIDATEAWLLRDRIGETFAAVVIDSDAHAATVVLDDPPVRARCTGAGLVAGSASTLGSSKRTSPSVKCVSNPPVGQPSSEPSSTVTALPRSSTRSPRSSTATRPPRCDNCAPSRDVRPSRAAQNGARAQCAEPVTGSSSTPTRGAKKRETKSTPLPPAAAAVTMTPRQSTARSRAMSGASSRTAVSSATSTSTSTPLPYVARGTMPSASASPSGSSIGADGWAGKSSVTSAPSIVAVSTPLCVWNANGPRAPRSASTWAVASVAWPHSRTSAAGVNQRRS